MLQTNSVSAIAVKDMTIVRANVIAKRTGSLEMGIAKAMLIERHVNGRGVSRENYATTAVWDCEASAWKSFRWESLIKVF